VKTRLKGSVQQSQQVQAQIQSSLQLIEGQAATYARNFQQAMRITADIHKREQGLKELRDRLNFLQNERGAMGFVRLVTPAMAAESPLGVGKTKMLLLVLVLACVLAVAAPVALDLLDRRIGTVNEAEKLMGIPAAGWQLQVADLPSRLYAREQTRRFASTLMRNQARSGKNVFSFSSVRTLGGGGTVVLDTAAVLQQLGWRVLVVDANSFAPCQAFSVSVPGLTDYLSGDAELDVMAQSLVHQEQTLSGVGFGSVQAFGIQRLDRLKQAVSSWSASHDFVLIDLPPLLLSADAELLIDALGQVFLVLEAQAVSRGEVMRAKRLLEKLDPEAVGLFVNNIPMFDNGGYMKEVMVETLSGRKLSDFMSLSRMRLEIELLRAQWVQRRNRQ
jgi:Mrp family chromosome partitioning ATPase